jgi:long-chain acyl-CoA synthetase
MESRRHLPAPPDKPALIFGEQILSFAELDERSGQCAEVIMAAGAREGGIVAVMLRNGLEFFEFSFGAARAGNRVTPINWHLRIEEVSWLLHDSGARILIANSSIVSATSEALANIPSTTILEVQDSAAGHKEITRRDLVSASGPWIWPDLVFYTSGTSGRPRAVEREVSGIESGERYGSLGTMWGLTGDDTWLVCSPLYHAANAYAYATLLCGGTVAVLERWDAREWLRTVARHRVTGCFMVPAHFIRLLEVPAEERASYDLSSLRLVLHAAAPCPVPVKREVLAALPSTAIWEFYGATEGGATRISSDDWVAHPGSVGRPWPGVEIRILDPSGRPCPPGESGLIYVHSASGSRFRYRNDPEKTETAWRDGAFTVGDMGYLDEQGYLYITDRASDMVIRGGVNIYPAEIETALHRHPLVIDCAVFGIPDDRMGEELKALVEVRSPIEPDALGEFLRQHLADYKVPRDIEILDTLPRDPLGKVVKRLLRAAYWQGARNAVTSN